MPSLPTCAEGSGGGYGYGYYWAANERSRWDTEGPDHVADSGLDLQEQDPALKRPPRYLVVMLNDDYTPMEFVVEVLQKVFAMGEAKAVQTMLQVHTGGSAICGVYTKDIAETKCAQVIEFARLCEHPLKCRIEPASEDDPC